MNKTNLKLAGLAYVAFYMELSKRKTLMNVYLVAGFTTLHLHGCVLVEPSIKESTLTMPKIYLL